MKNKGIIGGDNTLVLRHLDALSTDIKRRGELDSGNGTRAVYVRKVDQVMTGSGEIVFFVCNLFGALI